MPRKSLKNLTLQYLRQNAGIHYSSRDMEEFGKSNGYLGETCRKRTMDLVNEGLVNHEVKDGVSYYWVSEPKREVYGRVLTYDENGQPFYRELTREIW